MRLSFNMASGKSLAAILRPGGIRVISNSKPNILQCEVLQRCTGCNRQFGSGTLAVEAWTRSNRQKCNVLCDTRRQLPFYITSRLRRPRRGRNAFSDAAQNDLSLVWQSFKFLHSIRPWLVSIYVYVFFFANNRSIEVFSGRTNERTSKIWKFQKLLYSLGGRSVLSANRRLDCNLIF